MTNQKDWHEAFDVRPIFEGYANKIGLDVEQFKRDLTGEIVERRIFLDGKRARRWECRAASQGSANRDVRKRQRSKKIGAQDRR